MAEPFLGEIKLVSFEIVPKGWARCNGALLPINQNQALFSLFGTTYGGDGRVNFALPNLGGRVPMHQGDGFIMGQAAGSESHSLSIAEIPAHTHEVRAADVDGDVAIPDGAALARFNNGYGPLSNPVTLNSATISPTGSGTPHENMSPFLVLSYIVAIQGIFPSRN